MILNCQMKAPFHTDTVEKSWECYRSKLTILKTLAGTALVRVASRYSVQENFSGSG